MCSLVSIERGRCKVSSLKARGKLAHADFVLLMCVSQRLAPAIRAAQLLQVNYFPSRYDPVRHAEKVPYNNTYISGQREKRIIEKENNFK